MAMKADRMEEMPRGVPHSDDTNAAVMAALLAGQGVTEVADRYKLPKSTVSRIKSELLPEQLEQIGTERGRRIEDRLFAYLDLNFDALDSQARVAADEQYLKQFPPQQLAILHGVMADKNIRLLEAASAGSAAGPEGDG